MMLTEILADGWQAYGAHGEKGAGSRVGHGSGGDSSVAKAKAPGCKTEGFLSGSLVAGVGSEPTTFGLRASEPAGQHAYEGGATWPSPGLAWRAWGLADA